MSTPADPQAQMREMIEAQSALLVRNAFIAGYIASRPNVSRELIAGMADEYVAGMLEARRQFVAMRATAPASDAVFDPAVPPVRLLS